MFDLDHFKTINDRYGHAVGDAALRVFAETIQYTMRDGDVIGRLGGEEFAAFVPGSVHEAAIAAERVRAKFEAAGAVIVGHSLSATVSIGAADCLANGCDVGRLLSRADAALYASKQAGRNRITCAPDDVGPTVDAPQPAGEAAEAAGLSYAI